MLSLIKKNLFIFLWGVVLEVTYLLVIILENKYPHLIEQKILLYSFFILSSLPFLFLNYKYSGINESKKTLRLIIFFFIIFNLTLIFSSPLGQGDVFNYLYRAKVYIDYQQNPFLVAPTNFPDDPLARYVSTLGKSTPVIYGPLWVLISFIPALIAQNSIFIGLVVFKIIFFIFSCGCFFLIFKIISNLGFKNQNLILISYGWSPLLLFETINEGHNDIVMIFFVLLAILLLLKRKFNLVLPALTLSVAIKYITILLLPIFLFFLVKKLPTLKEKIKFVLVQLFAFCFIMFILFLPFWQGPATLVGFFSQAAKINLYHLSAFPFLVSFFTKETQLIRAVSYFAFLPAYFYIIFRQNKDEEFLIKQSFWILTVYLMLASLWFQPWYLIWLIPLAIISGQPGYISAAIFFSVFGLIHQGYNIFFLTKSMFGL